MPFSHDAFFKYVLKNENDARSFLKGVLPEKQGKQIDFSTLKLTTESYVNEVLRQSYSDLVFEEQQNKQ